MPFPAVISWFQSNNLTDRKIAPLLDEAYFEIWILVVSSTAPKRIRLSG